MRRKVRKTPSAVPPYCVGCKLYSGGGIPDGKHNRWCCHFGRPAPEAISLCIQQSARKTAEETNQ